MSDYISREAVLEAIENCVQIGNTTWTDKYAARARIDDIPAADVVEVVRCGECMQRDEKTGWCDAVQDYISNTNWFCAAGERKGGADE